MNLEQKRWDRHCTASRLLSFCLRTTDVCKGWSWTGDAMVPVDAFQDVAGQARTELMERLLRSPQYTKSRTELRRVLEHYFPNSHSSVRRSDILRRLSSPLVLLNGYKPSIALESFRLWRTLCHFNDEEVLIASAIGEAIYLAEGDALIKNSDHLWKLADHFVRAWDVTVKPVGEDVLGLFESARNDCHVHYGQLIPANVFWRLLMQSLYSPVESTAGESPLPHMRDKCGPEYIVQHHETWRDSRWQLIGALNLSASDLWNRHVRKSLFPGVVSMAPPSWEDCQAGAETDFLKRFLFPERMLLICGYYLAQAEPSFEEEAFWRYLSARSLFSWSHIPRTAGFEEFVRTEDIDAKGGYVWGDADGTDVWFVLVAAWLHATGIGRMDVRHRFGAGHRPGKRTTSIPVQASRFFDPLITARRNLVDEGFDQQTLHCNIVMCFSRGVVDSWSSTYGRRADGWRRLRAETLEKAAEWRVIDDCRHHTEFPSTSWVVSAVDAISNEYGFDAGIVAPAFRQFRRRVSCDAIPDDHRFGVRNAAGYELAAAVPLARYYHSGEDIEHPVTALRNMAEAIEFIDMDVNDRIGHASVLLEEPQDHEVEETFGERLDNLVCLWAFAAEGSEPDSNLLTALQTEIQVCHSAVHERCGVSASLYDLKHAWHARARTEKDILARFGKRNSSVMQCYLGFAGVPMNEVDGRDQWPESIRGDAEEVFQRRGERTRGFYTGTWWQYLRNGVVREILRRGLSIESCPSSNLTISGGWAAPLPTLGLINLGLEAQLVVGTDDPKMLKTDIDIELSLIANALLSTHGRRKAVFSSLSLCEAGEDPR